MQFQKKERIDHLGPEGQSGLPNTFLNHHMTTNNIGDLKLGHRVPEQMSLILNSLAHDSLAISSDLAVIALAT